MKTIKEFNQHLNSSYDKNSAYRRWSAYREKLTDFVIDGLSLASQSEDILIVGSGHLNDLDFIRLYEKANHIEFLDLDVQATEKALMSKGIPQSSYTLIDQDLVCLDKSLNENLEAALGGLILKNDKDSFSKLISRHSIAYNIGTYDIIIILPVYTQILFQQLLQKCMSYGTGVKQDTQLFLMQEVAGLLDRINSELCSHLRPKGQIMVFSDVLEYTDNDPDFLALGESFNNQAPQKFDTLANQVYDNYLQNYGYTLGAYGIYNMASQIKESAERFLMWEFDNRRKLLVKGIIGTKV